jgi:hypothetical protein
MSTTEFALTESHIKLARAMYVAWQDCETGAPEIDPKRPYGNSGEWTIAADIAAIIGAPWPDEEAIGEDEYERQCETLVPRMLAIHREMTTALQIILGNAGNASEPGNYRNIAERYYRPKWIYAGA